MLVVILVGVDSVSSQLVSCKNERERRDFKKRKSSYSFRDLFMCVCTRVCDVIAAPSARTHTHNRYSWALLRSQHCRRFAATTTSASNSNNNNSGGGANKTNRNKRDNNNCNAERKFTHTRVVTLVEAANYFRFLSTTLQKYLRGAGATLFLHSNCNVIN